MLATDLGNALTREQERKLAREALPPRRLCKRYCNAMLAGSLLLDGERYQGPRCPQCAHIEWLLQVFGGSCKESRYAAGLVDRRV